MAASGGTMTITLNIETIIQSIDQTRLQPGDILHITLDEDVPANSAYEIIETLQKRIAVPGIVYLMTGPGVSLESLSEDEMARHGWQRRILTGGDA
jgi:superfamily I DNA and RNA helicase